MSETLLSDSAASPEQLSKIERSLSVDPGNLRLFNDCAALALRLEDYEALLRTANTRLRLHPTDLAAVSARAQALLAKGELGHAAAELEKVAVARPTDPAAQQDLGFCYYSQGEFEWAREPLETALQLGERGAGLLRLLISTWRHLGLLAKAEALAATNTGVAETDAGLAGVFALLYLDLRRGGEASAWAERALALDAANEDALTVERRLASSEH